MFINKYLFLHSKIRKIKGINKFTLKNNQIEGLKSNYYFFLILKFINFTANSNIPKTNAMIEQSNIKLELGGKTYKTVKINNEFWMAENLNFPIEGSYFYDNDLNNGEKHGRLYTWDAAMKACPKGWHLPSDKEWDEMLDTLGGPEEAYSKIMFDGEAGLKLDFSGYKTVHGDFLSLDRAGDFWTSTDAGDLNAWLRYVIHKKENVFKIIDDKRCGFSVRYVKD